MPATILVVDDSILVRRQLRVTLEAGGFEVVDAANGSDARVHLDGTPIAMAILDVNMPEVGGLAFLAALRSLDRWMTLPVIFLTAEADPALISEAKRLGASAWLVKPFDPKKLVETARRLTESAAA